MGHSTVLGRASLYLPFLDHLGHWSFGQKVTLKLAWPAIVTQRMVFLHPFECVFVLLCEHTITGLSLDVLWYNFTPAETEHYSWFTF